MGGRCRMVRGDLRKTDVKSEKARGRVDAQTQTEAPEEPAASQRAQSPESRAEGELDLLQWRKLRFEDELESWPSVSTQQGSAWVVLVAITDHLHR